MSQPTFHRSRRLRQSAALREISRETRLHPSNLIMPYFVVDNHDPHYLRPINSMPGQYQFSLARLERHLEKVVAAGLRSVILFGIPETKDATGSGAWADNGIVQRATRMIKQRWPDLIVITDVCLCEYTSHGHCGVLDERDCQGKVLNDPTLELLALTALSHARAGADIVAPSDMMDGRVQAIRASLDCNGFTETPIMSYAAKFASVFYGPFREAAESTPSFGDRRSYQMDGANAQEALREVEADLQEGADIVLVKPGGPYQDIIRLIYDTYNVPLGAYQVSGEYSMLHAAAQNNWLDLRGAALETLLGLRRSGATYLISYFTEQILLENWLDN